MFYCLPITMFSLKPIVHFFNPKIRVRINVSSSRSYSITDITPIAIGEISTNLHVSEVEMLC